MIAATPEYWSRNGRQQSEIQVATTNDDGIFVVEVMAYTDDQTIYCYGQGKKDLQP